MFIPFPSKNKEYQVYAALGSEVIIWFGTWHKPDMPVGKDLFEFCFIN